MKARCILLLLLFIQPTAAWKTGYHAQICESALLQADVKWVEKDAFLSGCKAPDNERDSYPPHHLTKDLSRIEAYFQAARESFGTGDYTTASFNAGVAAHYIADFASPAHNGADPDCHSWIEDTRPQIYFVSAEKKTIELKELLGAAANNSKEYAQQMSEYCRNNDTASRDAAMERLASYSAFNTALTLDSIADYGTPQRAELQNYALTDYPVEKKQETRSPLPALAAIIIILLLIRKH